MDLAKALKTIAAGIALVVVLISLTVITKAAEGKSDALTSFFQKILGLGPTYKDPGIKIGMPDGDANSDDKTISPHGNGNVAPPTQTSSSGGASPFAQMKTEAGQGEKAGTEFVTTS